MMRKLRCPNLDGTMSSFVREECLKVIPKDKVEEEEENRIEVEEENRIEVEEDFDKL
jgi:hypothetical protein